VPPLQYPDDIPIVVGQSLSVAQTTHVLPIWCPEQQSEQSPVVHELAETVQIPLAPPTEFDPPPVDVPPVVAIPPVVPPPELEVLPAVEDPPVDEKPPVEATPPVAVVDEPPLPTEDEPPVLASGETQAPLTHP